MPGDEFFLRGLRPDAGRGNARGMDRIEDINDMISLRTAIDALDAELIALLARRSRLIDRAAQIKLVENLPARIDTRVEEVAANARRLAGSAGLDPDLAEALWRRMMDHFIDQEDRVLQKKDISDDGTDH